MEAYLFVGAWLAVAIGLLEIGSKLCNKLLFSIGVVMLLMLPLVTPD